MDDIRDIRLEFLRSGPAHNQLISPLTSYMALCGAEGPVSVHLPFEHAQLLTRLERLRYEIDGHAVAASQRMAELQELGGVIARFLGKIPALVCELHPARGNTDQLVNIRLVVSAFELGLVPFETTLTPSDTSGSGAPLLLRTRTTITREIRRGQPLKLAWNRAPRILFAFASPTSLPAVPAQAHLEALRRAIDPWINPDAPAESRLAQVRQMLTVLPNATVKQISQYCQEQDYTHVHILAHGAPMPGTDGRHFGVALAQEGEASGYAVVDGQGLAMALKGLKLNGQGRPAPTVVTLATCDSGNVGTVLTPGGSIAHELHAQDIPWVIASQFPLWMRASEVATEIIYRGLLSGLDPRLVLHEVRQRLCLDFPDTHDWASIVAYATIAPDLDEQVDAFRSRQTKRKMDVMFARIDSLVGSEQRSAGQPVTQDAAAREQIRQTLSNLRTAIRADLKAWAEEDAACRSAREQAERMGMRASSEKRIAIAQADFGEVQDSAQAYRLAFEYYLAAIKIEPANHWVLTQFLSMAAIPQIANTDAAREALHGSFGPWWMVARQLAQWGTQSDVLAERVWAHGTLAELDLLGSVYQGAGFKHGETARSLLDHCAQVRDLSKKDDFPILSTQRQFSRYLTHWSRPEWRELAQAALDALAGVEVPLAKARGSRAGKK